MKTEYLDQQLHDLWGDYLDFCEKYAGKIADAEFAFAMTRMVSKMAFDLAPNEGVAYKLLLAGIEQGMKESYQEKQ
jgi:hypothetical protein